MTLPIGNLTPHRQGTDADPASVEAQRTVAKQFEAIFLRQLLGTLEKTGSMGGSSNGGAAIFRSMMVGALADGAAEAGGIGLAEIVFKAMLPPAATRSEAAVEAASVPLAPALRGGS